VTTVPATRLMRKRRRPWLAVTSASVALFRLGEICNNACPMCSNSGRPEAFRIARDDLLRRVTFLREQGFARVVVTGGEPTVHPAFEAVVAELQRQRITWDINTHGRTFADPAYADRALELGLERAIVSFHSHVAAASSLISGFATRGHEQTVQGITNLVRGGAEVMLNLVICTHNQGHLADWVDFCADTFGTDASVDAVTLKVCFPYTGGKGGGWRPIHIRYSDVRGEVLRARDRAEERGLTMLFESFPNCVIGDPLARNLSRSGFGETHYLEDIRGLEVFPIRHIEAELSVYAAGCRGCSALSRCGGVSELYAREFGTDELIAFSG